MSDHESLSDNKGPLWTIGLVLLLAILIGALGFFGNQWQHRSSSHQKIVMKPPPQDPIIKTIPTPSAPFSISNPYTLTPTPSPSITYPLKPITSPTPLRWQEVFAGYGTIKVTDGTVILEPKVPTTPEGHAILVITERDHPNPVTIKLKMRTVRQLRTSSTPEPWEVGWLFFNYQDLANYDYFILKTNGVELGKKQGSNTQIFLQTETQPRLALNTWHQLEITLKLNHIMINVDGVPAINYTDTRPLPLGRLGLYSESALVEFTDISIE